MINEEKVKVMTKLAMYEKREAKRYLPVSKYFRGDYIGLALIKNFFLVTIGYGLLLVAAGAYYGEYLLDNIHKMNLINLGTYLVVGYIVMLAAFSALTYVQYFIKYHRAKKSVKEYYGELTRLERIYGREEKKNAGRGMSGGNKR